MTQWKKKNNNNEPIQWPASSWLVSSIGKALRQYRRGQELEA